MTWRSVSMSSSRLLLLLVAVIFATASQSRQILEDNVLTSRPRLVVPVGRTVFLNPDQLQIRVRPGDQCLLLVIDNDPLTQRVGSLSPPTFNCKFGPREVMYSHFGLIHPTVDVIRMQLRYDSDSQIVIVPFTIDVQVENVPLEVVRRNSPLLVERVLGGSTPITNENLEFNYAVGIEQCKISILPTSNGLPRYGLVMNDSFVSHGVDCDSFLKLGIRYKHTNNAHSLNKDYIPLVVEIYDSDEKVYKKEYFHKLVTIVGGRHNDAPSPDFSSKLSLVVGQFALTAVTSQVLAASDTETAPDFLIFNITKPLKANQGYFISTDGRKQRLTSFYQRDVRELKIAYQPPPGDSRGPRNFAVEFQIIDSEGAVSVPFIFTILLKPLNPLAPFVKYNRGIKLFEGQSRPLLGDYNLELSVESDEDKVEIKVVDGLKHGQLHIPHGRGYFTAADLRAGAVVYQHDHSDTFADNIVFRMTADDHVVEFLFPVWIFPVDDEHPILNVNAGLEVKKNQLVEISSTVLSATDKDSDDALVRFVLEPPYPQGVILKRQSLMPDDPNDWKLVDGFYELVVEEFTMSDISRGIIFYRNVGPHRTDVFLDKVKFRVVDTGDPPNWSDLKEFVVKVDPVDDQLPYLYPNTSLRMEVADFQLTEFKRKFLRYTDDESDDRDIRFTISSGPFDTDSNSGLLPGIITLCDESGKKISVFTQAQVNQRKICYMPPPEGLGLFPRIIQFVYDVQDANGNSLKDERFTILLKPVDNQPPKIKNAGVSVFEGGLSILTTDMLDAEDPDTREDSLLFILLEAPEHGQLTRMGEIMENGDSFTRNDIRQGQIAYFNSGNDVGDDKIVLEVTDGFHRLPVKFNVHVKSSDDERPVLVGAESDVLKVVLEVLENSAVALSSDNIRTADPDSGNNLVVFHLERAPYEGVLLQGSEQVTEFSQADLDNDRVVYRHTGGEIGLRNRQDFFELTLTSPKEEIVVGGNRISKVVVEVRILPDDNEPPIVTIGAPFEVSESKKATLFPRHLDATDVDTEDCDITCLVVEQPRSGYLENITPHRGSEKSRMGKPISSFTIRDIRSAHVNYVQSVHRGVEPRKDSFMFHCSDGISESDNFQFDVNITPFNDEEPEVSLREFIVMEGGNLRIDLPILNVVDRDEPADQLDFVITEQPKHGKIVRQTRDGSFHIHNFTLDDISGESTIAYEHDDSETQEDSFTFYVVDGSHNISKTVPISVFPLDDESPRLTINSGLRIDNPGENKTIANKVLKAEDLDSNDADLMYFVRQKPRHGYLVRISGESVTNISEGGNFTQRDIDKKRIAYVHAGNGGVRDVIKFDITDGLNSLADRHFYITVDGADSLSPRIVNKGLTLPEGGVAVLTTDILSGTNLNSQDEGLIFVITRAPIRGLVESADTPGLPVATFTQKQLTNKKIRYVHNKEEEIRMDSFEFKVPEGPNNVPRTFRISVSDIENRRPVLMLQTLRLKEGHSKVLTALELAAEDRDTPPGKIVFTLTQVPAHGRLLFNKTRVTTSFTMAELNQELISYQHDGSASAQDSFSFTVTDGVHTDFYVVPHTDKPTKKPQSLPIVVLPLDTALPQISVNRGASYLAELAGNHIGFRITNRILSTEDRDSADDNILYSLTSAPKWGYLINRAIGNRSISNWTQGDINRQQIEYILRPGVNATADSFFFAISDKGGNLLTSQPFHLNWAWISLEKDLLVVNETDSSLNLTLKRRGYLGETAFVTITAINGSAKSGEDFSSRYTKQVQLNPGQTEKNWRLRLTDDDRHERAETFELRLSDPIMAVIEYPDVAQVTIMDQEDEPVVLFSDSQYRVAEDIGEILLPIKRLGDVSEETMVICSTLTGSATGTVPSAVTSHADYVTRTSDHRSLVRFDKGEKEKFCRVVIVDDLLYEPEEAFWVRLSEPIGGKLGETSSLEVIIEPDRNDEPVFFFGSSEYVVDESDGFVEVKVMRTGTDINTLSTVSVRTRKSDPKSADAGLDYVSTNTVLEFPPGVTTQTVSLTILDDLVKPRLEGEERFLVILRSPTNGILGEPKESVIVINDSISDLPTMEFKEVSYRVSEKNRKLEAVIVRSGDLSHHSAVRCHTRQATATADVDYVERADADSSIVIFEPGESDKVCAVEVKDDLLFEGDEHFRLVLSPATNWSLGGSHIGRHNLTVVTIYDEEDRPVIKLADKQFRVKEPMFRQEVGSLRLPVVREGDLSETAIVTVYSKDGSAETDRDYKGFFTELTFGYNQSKIEVEVLILYDGETESRESFSVHLKSQSGTARIENAVAEVFIEERTAVVDVTFPGQPRVVSLRDYDRVTRADPQPGQGYPIICVTTCNPRHPDFPKNREACERDGINDALTLFRWRLSAPADGDDEPVDLRDVELSTFVTSGRAITLDSIYFTAGSRVQCGARAINLNGEPGLELLSEVVVISKGRGMCEPRGLNFPGVEPFSARMSYTGAGDANHPNQVRLTVVVPHRDGLLPVISLQPLSSLELTINSEGPRLPSHKCSNIEGFNLVNNHRGFVKNGTRKGFSSADETEPYQFDAMLRSLSTVQFYRKLDLKACAWVFESDFPLSEIVDLCGGKIVVDQRMTNFKQSYASLLVPLSVSYVFYSPVGRGSWQNYDMTSELQMTFVYDTPVLWQAGIRNTGVTAGLEGSLYPRSIRLQEDGSLLISFSTEAKFRGQFITSYPGTSLESRIISSSLPDLTLTQLLQSDATFDKPSQDWTFISDSIFADYSGVFHIQLIPCVANPDQEFTQPMRCQPREPLRFDLPIRFQQVSNSVPSRFSLNANFRLHKGRESLTVESNLSHSHMADAVFSPGDYIYGHISADPIQARTGSQLDLSVDKVFLCSGRDGYIPKFNPDNQEFGCMVESPNLRYTLKILDRAAPSSVANNFRDIPFKAKLAQDDSGAGQPRGQNVSDGFSISCLPLFQAEAGSQWFLHVIYTFLSLGTSDQRVTRHTRDWSYPVHSLAGAHRWKRSHDDALGVGEEGKGTNMARVQLDDPRASTGDIRLDSSVSPGGGDVTLIIILISLIVLIVLIALLIIYFVRRRRKSTSPPISPTNTITVVQNGKGKVIVTKYLQRNGSHVEV